MDTHTGEMPFYSVTSNVWCTACGGVNNMHADSCPYQTKKSSPLKTQQGGKHYKEFAIQPIEFIHANKIPFMEANIIKYAVRHQSKNGADDIRKIIHYCELILELQYGEKP